jgi:hypothetical protein
VIAFLCPDSSLTGLESGTGAVIETRRQFRSAVDKELTACTSSCNSSNDSALLIGIAPLAARISLFLIACPCNSDDQLGKRILLDELTLHVHPLFFPEHARGILDFLSQTPLYILCCCRFDPCRPRSRPDCSDEGGTFTKVLLVSLQPQW